MEARNEIAGAALVEKGDLLADHCIEELTAKRGNNPLPDDAEVVGAEIKACALESEEPDQPESHVSLVDAKVFGIRAVDEPANDLRKEQIDPGPGAESDHRDDKRAEVGANELVSVITKGSVERLGIKVGDEVVAIIKSTEVMLGK